MLKEVGVFYLSTSKFWSMINCTCVLWSCVVAEQTVRKKISELCCLSLESKEGNKEKKKREKRKREEKKKEGKRREEEKIEEERGRKKRRGEERQGMHERDLLTAFL